MNVRQAKVTGRETVRRSSTEVRRNLPLLSEAGLPKGLQQQGNP
jgi:hypothetical protein